MQPSFVYETIDALDLPPRGAGDGGQPAAVL